MNLRWLPLALVGATWGCKSVPEGRVGVAAIRFEGTGSLHGSDLRSRIATQEAPKFLGLFRASWQRYEDFEPEVLEKDLQRIEHYYRRRGYYDTEVRVGRVEPGDGKFVDVEILIREGEAVRVHTITLAGLEGRPKILALRAQEGIGLQAKDVFDQDKFEASTVGIAAAMTNMSYAYVVVTPQATVDLGPRTADIAFHIDLGIPCTVGPITFEGLGDLPENLVRRTFDVKTGDRYKTEDLDMGRKALLNLGVFASVEIVPDLSNPKRSDVPVKVVVTRSALRGLRAGGGLTIDFTRTDVHGLIGWEHRNFLGGMRHFLIEERPSLVFFPTALSDVHAPSHVFPANSISARLTQPAFPEARTATSVRFEFSSYPIILSPVNPLQEVFPGYHELRGTIGPERYFPSIAFRAAILYNLQANFPFTYVGVLNPPFEDVIRSRRAVSSVCSGPATTAPRSARTSSRSPTLKPRSRSTATSRSPICAVSFPAAPTRIAGTATVPSALTA
jgi:outer membrane protein insertion porin family/translocation and assembly module TamA